MTLWSQLVGESLGVSDWLQMDQQRINAFAEATGDHQFIHVDPVAAAQTPFGGTIAHGLLTLSLIPHWLYPLLAPHTSGQVTTVNYGTDNLRYLLPVRSSDRVRLNASVASVEEKGPGRTLVRLNTTVEIEGADKPALVAESLLMVIEPLDT